MNCSKRLLPTLLAVLFFALTVMSGGAGAATLNVIGGILHGASGVDVGGTLYDVEFVDGTCIGLLSGCDEPSDFTFQSEAQAQAASSALFEQVFVDGLLGQFDSAPELTRGCETGDSYCAVITVFDLNSIGHINVQARNLDPFTWHNHPAQIEVFGDLMITDCCWDRGHDHSVDGDVTFAIWAVAIVPEPNTALLLGIGLAGLAARKGRVV